METQLSGYSENTKFMIGVYPAKVRRYESLKEQLRLFALNGAVIPSPTVLAGVQKKLSTREKLAALLEGELNLQKTGHLCLGL